MTPTVQFRHLREIKIGGINLKERVLPEGLSPKEEGAQVLETLNFVFQGQQVIFAGSIAEFTRVMHGCSDEFVRKGFLELQQLGFVAITGDYFLPTKLFVEYYERED